MQVVYDMFLLPDSGRVEVLRSSFRDSEGLVWHTSVYSSTPPFEHLPFCQRAPSEEKRRKKEKKKEKGTDERLRKKKGKRTIKPKAGNGRGMKEHSLRKTAGGCQKRRKKNCM